MKKTSEYLCEVEILLWLLSAGLLAMALMFADYLWRRMLHNSEHFTTADKWMN